VASLAEETLLILLLILWTNHWDRELSSSREEITDNQALTLGVPWPYLLEEERMRQSSIEGWKRRLLEQERRTKNLQLDSIDGFKRAVSWMS